MPQNNSQLKPYVLPATAPDGAVRSIVVLASPGAMADLAAMGNLTLHAGAYQNVVTLMERAAIITALHERDAYLYEGGRLQ